MSARMRGASVGTQSRAVFLSPRPGRAGPHSGWVRLLLSIISPLGAYARPSRRCGSMSLQSGRLPLLFHLLRMRATGRLLTACTPPWNGALVHPRGSVDAGIFRADGGFGATIVTSRPRLPLLGPGASLACRRKREPQWRIAPVGRRLGLRPGRPLRGLPARIGLGRSGRTRWDCDWVKGLTAAGLEGRRCVRPDERRGRAAVVCGSFTSTSRGPWGKFCARDIDMAA